MPRVFIVSKLKHHEANLKDFGEMMEIFPNNYRRPSQFDSNEFVIAILNRLDELKYCENDYIAVTGNQNALFQLAVGLGLEKDNVKFLLFDARSNAFTKQEINRQEVVQ